MSLGSGENGIVNVTVVLPIIMTEETFDLDRFRKLRDHLDESIKREVVERSQFAVECGRSVQFDDRFNHEEAVSDHDDACQAASDEEPPKITSDSPTRDISLSMSVTTKAALQELGDRTKPFIFSPRSIFRDSQGPPSLSVCEDSTPPDDPASVVPIYDQSPSPLLNKGAASWRLLFGCSPPSSSTDSSSIRLYDPNLPRLQSVSLDEDKRIETTLLTQGSVRSDQDCPLLLQFGTLINSELQDKHSKNDTEEKEKESAHSKQQVNKGQSLCATTIIFFAGSIVVLFLASSYFLHGFQVQIVAKTKPLGHVPWVKSTTTASFHDLRRYIAKEQAMIVRKETPKRAINDDEL